MELRAIIRAFGDERVIRALEMALRDEGIHRRFWRLRQRGVTAAVAIQLLAEAECLSEERIRTIVYRKGKAAGRTTAEAPRQECP